MALIACTECGTKISDKAAACVTCGAPVNRIADQKVVKTELTAKKYKGQQLLAAALVGIGLVTAMADAPIVGVVIATLGFALYFIARSGAWWNHG